MRKTRVIYNEWEYNKEKKIYEKKEAGIAILHGWGVNYEQFDVGIGNYSTAIIECADGSVKNIPVEDINFIIANSEEEKKKIIKERMEAADMWKKNKRLKKGSN